MAESLRTLRGHFQIRHGESNQILRRREELRWSVVLLAFEVPMKPFGILHSLYISFQSKNTNLQSFTVLLIVLARF